MPETDGSFVDDPEVPPIEPLEVRVINPALEEQDEAARFSSFTGTNFAGTEAPQRILPRADKRKRAVIGACYTTVTGAYILVGKREQVMNNQGIRLYVGSEMIVESAPEIWCAPVASNAIWLNVQEERY
jgi:hypothetical protein